jgi:ATP-binding cassette, subfamily B, multidrug efflux pump
VAVVGLLLVIVPAASELAIPRLLQYVIDEGITPQDIHIILRGALLMVGVTLVGGTATVGQAICRARLSQGVGYDLRQSLYRHIQSLSFGNLDNTATGELMTRLSSDVDLVRMLIGMGLPLIFRALFTLIGSLIFLFLTDWQLAMIMLVLIPAIAVVFWYFVQRASPLFTTVQESLSALNRTAQENLAGVRVVRAFVREQYESHKFSLRNADYAEQNVRVGKLMAVVFPIIQLLTSLGTLAVFYMGGLRVAREGMTIGELVAFNNYLTTTMIPLLMLGMLTTLIARAEASATRVLEVLDTQPMVTDPPSPIHPTSLRGHVSFNDVSFRYDGHEGEEVLREINLTVQPGQRIALLGATGAGKTTLVNLIPRFYDVTDGNVLVDGIDVRHYAQDWLRSQIGMVLQQTILFAGTVRENIAFGEPNASIERIIDAAKVAQAHDFIMQMPEGYESYVEARGANLSGGQKQRIAIARALLVQPAILILDDSTSSVDLDTEYFIQQALQDVMGSRTTFIIAQRLSSVLSADSIIILDRGRIAAQGHHTQLLQESKIYQEIYRSQLADPQTPPAGDNGEQRGFDNAIH